MVHSPRAFRQPTAVHTLTLSYRKRGGPYYEEQRPHGRRGVGDHKQGENVWQTHRRGVKQPLDGLQKGFTHGDKANTGTAQEGYAFVSRPESNATWSESGSGVYGGDPREEFNIDAT